MNVFLRPTVLSSWALTPKSTEEQKARESGAQLTKKEQTVRCHAKQNQHCFVDCRTLQADSTGKQCPSQSKDTKTAMQEPVPVQKNRRGLASTARDQQRATYRNNNDVCTLKKGACQKQVQIKESPYFRSTDLRRTLD